MSARATLPLPRRPDDVVDPTGRSPRAEAWGPLPADVGSLAHDLRNILSSVRGYAQLLLSMVNEGKAAEYLGIVEAESSRCCDLIERMLRPRCRATSEGPDAARPTELSGNASAVAASAAQADVDPTAESDAARAAERVCELSNGEAALKGVELLVTVEPGTGDELPPPAIPREPLEIILLNLIRNGIQATPRGGRVEVRVRSCQLHGDHRTLPGGLMTARQAGIQVEVSDTGRGVPECASTMIFEPFFSTRAPGEGVGLGLSIASALVKRYGGSIQVESRVASGSTDKVTRRGKEGAGTTFTVLLPVRT